MQRMPPSIMVTSRALAICLTFCDSFSFISLLAILLFADDDAGGLDILAVDDAAGEAHGGFPGQLEDFDGIRPVIHRHRKAAEHPVARATREQLEAEQI